MKIAVYSCNTGNYRNEISVKALNQVQIVKGIDYHFFTDTDMDLSSCNWIVHKIKLKSKLRHMNAFRHTAKFYKFCVSEILAQYDYLIWCDTKCLQCIQSLDLTKITDFVHSTNKDFYFLKHYSRTTPRQELEITVIQNMENIYSARQFWQKIKHLDFQITLPETRLFIAKVNTKTLESLREVYNELLRSHLCRDQNVIQYILQTTSDSSQIYIFPNLVSFTKQIQSVEKESE